MNIWVSGKHTYDESKNVVSFQDGSEKRYEGLAIKLEIYQSRVKDWFFNVAMDHVKNGMSPGDYLALMVGLAYLEGVQQFREGKETPSSQSSEWFKNSAKRAIPGYSLDVYNRLWKETRCGLFHSGFPNGKIYLSHNRTDALVVDRDRLIINPLSFMQLIEDDFNTYINLLKKETSKELRENFETLWDQLWDAS